MTAFYFSVFRAMWVIGKLIYLTNRTVVEVKPKEVLVMSRPYGPPQVRHVGFHANHHNYHLETSKASLNSIKSESIL